MKDLRFDLRFDLKDLDLKNSKCRFEIWLNDLNTFLERFQLLIAGLSPQCSHNQDVSIVALSTAAVTDTHKTAE